MIVIDFNKLPSSMRNRLSENKKANINAMIKALNESEFLNKLKLPKITLERYVSYMLATAWHETGTAMSPSIEEIGKGRNRTYGTWYLNSKNVAYGFKDSSKKEVYAYTETQNLFYGRGYVQLTWYKNYEKAGKALNVDLVKFPEMALTNPIATQVMVLGMVNGWFTGVKLANYLSETKKDYLHARQIINGMDKADFVEGYARGFEQAISVV